jgi:hypothetical protein
MAVKYTKGLKICQMAVKDTKWPKIHQYFAFKGSPLSTKSGIFGMKIYHLATPL